MNQASIDVKRRGNSDAQRSRSGDSILKRTILTKADWTVLLVGLAVAVFPGASNGSTPQTPPEFVYHVPDNAWNFGPTDVATDAIGNVYVADVINDRIQKFDSGGNELARWGSRCILSTGFGCVDPDGPGPLQLGDGQFFFVDGVAFDPISGSVYTVSGSNHRVQKFDSAGNFIMKWGTRGTGNNQFDQPVGVTVDASGNVYVADARNHRIQKFDPDGNFLAGWGGFCNMSDGSGCVDPDGEGPLSSGDGQFNFPSAVDVDRASGDIYVADTENERVQRFASDQSFLTKWLVVNRSPQGVATDSWGNVYVTRFPSGVSVFDPDGTFQFEFGNGNCVRHLLDAGCIDPDGPGPLEAGDGVLHRPRGLAFDLSGNIFVADQTNLRVQQYDALGDFLQKWEARGGPGDGKFNSPFGVATAPDGSFYVADSVNQRIQKFDSAGNFLAKWGSSCRLSDGVGCLDPDGGGPLEPGDGQFFFPRAVAVDPMSGDVYVVDTANDRVQKFTSDGAFIAKWGSSCQLSDGSGCVDPDGGGPLSLGDGQFASPTGVAVDPSTRHVYVGGFNNRIQKFDSNGAFLQKWGSRCSIVFSTGPNCVDPDGGGPLRVGDGQFSGSPSLAVDAWGNVYATSGNARVQKFDSNGNFIRKWGRICRCSNNFGCFDPDGGGPLELGDGQFSSSALSVAVDPSGDVYVASPENRRVQKFTPNGVFLTKWGSPRGTHGVFNAPRGVAIDASYDVYVSDGSGHRVHKFRAPDTDGDGRIDPLDNCPGTSNPFQEDFEPDGAGDACDVQTCGNGVLEAPGGGLGFLFNEECDDGNNTSGDLCSATCELEENDFIDQTIDTDPTLDTLCFTDGPAFADGVASPDPDANIPACEGQTSTVLTGATYGHVSSANPSLVEVLELGNPDGVRLSALAAGVDVYLDCFFNVKIHFDAIDQVTDFACSPFAGEADPGNNGKVRVELGPPGVVTAPALNVNLRPGDQATVLEPASWTIQSLSGVEVEILDSARNVLSTIIQNASSEVTYRELFNSDVVAEVSVGTAESGGTEVGAGESVHVDSETGASSPLTPELEVQLLVEQMEDVGLTQGSEAQLVSKLDAAVQSLANGNATAAANQLGAFINAVNASNKLDEAQKSELLAAAQAIQEELPEP